VDDYGIERISRSGSVAIRNGEDHRMTCSVLTLVLLVDLLAPGGRLESCPGGWRGSTLARLDGGGPLWSVPAPEAERREHRTGRPEPRPEPRPEMECWTHRHEPIGPPDLAVGGAAAASGAEGDGEEPICVEDSRCSPVPTERSGVIPALKASKGLISSPIRCPAPVESLSVPPACLGVPAQGYSEPPFHPPRRGRFARRTH
jgi:hypothetical protein